MNKIIADFINETWMDFFAAIRKFYDYIDEDLLSVLPFTPEQIDECWEENLKKIIKNLTKIMKERLHRRDAIDSKKIDGYFRDTHLRCNGLRRRDTTNEAYLIMRSFIDEDKLRDIITKNPHKGWNPFMLCNWITWIVPCIFLPSRKLRDRYDFLTVKYNPDGSIAAAEVDAKRLQDYKWTLYINEDDILSFFYWLYHPYIWWLVQSKQRGQLTYNI